MSEEGKQRLQAALEKSARVPKYIRQAIKTLRKAVQPEPGEIVDVEPVPPQPELAAPKHDTAR